MFFPSLRKSSVALTACLILAPVVATAQDAPADKPKDGPSYLIGLSIAEQMKSQGLTVEDIDVASLAMAIADELSGRGPRLDEAEMKAADEKLRSMMQTRMQARMEKMQKEMQAAAIANKEKADLFLQENIKKEGVKELAKGLQYKVEKAGTGASPTPTSEVKVHYTGKLLNGEVFDSSVQRGTPATFPVNGLIKAWQTALPKMKVGDKWTLYSSPEMAYGANGSPPRIGPNELLIFEMELLEIVK